MGGWSTRVSTGRQLTIYMLPHARPWNTVLTPRSPFLLPPAPAGQAASTRRREHQAIQLLQQRLWKVGRNAHSPHDHFQLLQGISADAAKGRVRQRRAQRPRQPARLAVAELCNGPAGPRCEGVEQLAVALLYPAGMGKEMCSTCSVFACWRL